jgi:SET domain-containing protein
MQAPYLSMRGDLAILDSATYFINHSCVNNAEANDEFVEGEGYREVVRAKRRISPGDEITMNYGTSIF